MNGDGFDDVIVGETDGFGSSTGLTSSYIVFGEATASVTRVGTSGNDRLFGGDFDDSLDGGAGADAMHGGLGNDFFIVDNAGDAAVEVADAGTDTVLSSISYRLAANVENLTLSGAANIDATGNELNNTILGGAGDNRLDGQAGADTMHGGFGNDVFIVDNAGDAAVEVADAGIDTVLSFHLLRASRQCREPDARRLRQYRRYRQRVNNTILGGAGDNRLDGRAGADTMHGGLGNDLFIVDNAGDTTVEVADAGIDTVVSSISYRLALNVENLTLAGAANIDATGNELNNTILGGAGDNRLDGQAGADAMHGGFGNDVFIVDNAGDAALEVADAGVDTVVSSVSFMIAANVENFTLSGAANIDATGNELNNTILGGAGDNRLDGQGGADAMHGGLGNDFFIVDNAGDAAVEVADAGIDTVLSSISYRLAANVENLTLTGSANIDATGNSSANVLKGNTGRNRLSGGDGEDVLNGGDGNDRLNGGAAEDVFVFGDNDGRDRITDFHNGSDTIDLTAVDEVTRFRDLEITDTDSGVLIDYGNGTIQLDDVTSASIGRGDFIFA